MNNCIVCDIPIENSTRTMCEECEKSYANWMANNTKEENERLLEDQGHVEITEEEYHPTEEDEELFRQDMMDPAMFGELSVPPENEPDLPEDFNF